MCVKDYTEVLGHKSLCSGAKEQRKPNQEVNTSLTVLTVRVSPPNTEELEKERKSAQNRKIKKWAPWDEQQALVPLRHMVSPPPIYRLKGQKVLLNTSLNRQLSHNSPQAPTVEECNTFFKGGWHHPNKSPAEPGSLAQFTWKPGTQLSLSLLSYIISIRNPWHHTGVRFWPDVEFEQTCFLLPTSECI